MSEFRLGDILDDYCIKCKRLTNHAIVSLVGTDPAKVRCCSCYKDHNYDHAVVPPTKKDQCKPPHRSDWKQSDLNGLCSL